MRWLWCEWEVRSLVPREYRREGGARRLVLQGQREHRHRSHIDSRRSGSVRAVVEGQRVVRVVAVADLRSGFGRPKGRAHCGNLTCQGKRHMNLIGPEAIPCAVIRPDRLGGNWWQSDRLIDNSACSEIDTIDGPD